MPLLRNDYKLTSRKVPRDSTPQLPLFFFCSVHHAVPQSRAAKRMALTWTDFLSTEFTRTYAPLSATPQFSASIVCSISSRSQPQAGTVRKLVSLSYHLNGTSLSSTQRRCLREACIGLSSTTSCTWRMDVYRARGALARCNWVIYPLSAQFGCAAPTKPTPSGLISHF